MSKPFFIWTMRRTGGTSLTTLLTEISEYSTLQHEPFNGDRVWGHFVNDFRKNVSSKKISSNLNNALADTPLIKHCYENFGKEFNNIIINAADKYPYKHIFLRREDDVSRLMSLFLAKQIDVWGPEQKGKKYDEIISGKFKLELFNIDEMIKHYHWCKKLTCEIQDQLTKHGKEFKIISFEDFYIGDREIRLKKLSELLSYLEFDDSVMEIHAKLIEKQLFHKSQNSQSILKYVPNYEEVKNTFDLLLSKEKK